ncbi:MAG: sensor histidine kinase, partial [Alphaproteobacteria bacterium]
MSHEIRTPMNAIMGLADLALRMEMTPRLRDYLSKIANASHSLLRIINDILDFSKAEAGKITLESTDFEMGRVCENLADLFRDQVDEKNLELVMGMDPACPTALRGDSLRLEQVLMNLIGNAIKFTAQGSIRVWVTMEPPPA